MLSNSDEFVSHGRSGWTLADTELRRVSGEYQADLTDSQVLETISSWDNNRKIPQDIDSMLLVRARAGLGRDLSDAERSDLRSDFIECLRHVAPIVAERGDK
jgi:hypothetical protein